jgi:pyrroline-5-carboxylate reductase
MRFANVGIIGCGNMGSALARAMDGQVPELVLSNRRVERAQALAQELECLCADNQTIASRSQLIVLAVKPQQLPELLQTLAPILQQRRDRFVLCTMAAGVTIASLRSLAGGDYPVVRIMPNTPVSVGLGAILWCSDGVTQEEQEAFCAQFREAGALQALPEHLMDAGSALTGCGPAFVDLFLEALADGAVACGLPRDIARTGAAQMLLGAAALALRSEEHPGVLKDAVCSPGGSTIQGVRTLEQHGFRSAVMEAVIAAYEKTAALGKQGSGD